jgi:hypothetical protein
MIQALATRDALRICKEDTNRPDLFIHENGAWHIRGPTTQENTFSTKSINHQMSTEDASEVLQSNKPRSDEFEIIKVCGHKSSINITAG